MRVTIKIKKKEEQPLILAKLVCFQGEERGKEREKETPPPLNHHKMPFICYSIRYAST